MQPLFVGIDGGGTKTRCLVADRSGTPLGEGLAGPCNYHAVGIELATANLRSALTAALDAAGATQSDVTAVCAGLAGAGRPEDVAIWQKALGRFLHAPVRIEPDARIALEGALGGQPGVVVIAGTGSIAWGMDQHGKTVRAGGWGFLLGDEGSGFDIGRRAVTAALGARDGTGAPTILCERICTAWELASIEKVVPVIYGDVAVARTKLAELVPLVVRTARSGDAVAQQLLVGAGQALGHLAAAALANLALPDGTPELVATTGGVILSVPAVADALAASLAEHRPGARLIPQQRTPAEGAVHLALQLAKVIP